MLVVDLAFFVVAFLVLLKSADFSTRYTAKLARTFHLSEFALSFFIIAVISTLPEAAVSLVSAVERQPEFGLATLLGSNVADLTLVFAIVTLYSLHGLKVRSRILRTDYLYMFLLIFPLLLGMDGNFSRPDGLLLVLSGLFFFFTLSIETHMFRTHISHLKDRMFLKDFVLLGLCVAGLLVSAHFTISYGVRIAEGLALPPVLVGLLVVALGTCLPEMVFSLRSVKIHHDALALGDILGTVIIDATILIGLMALIRPYSFNPNLIYITGSAMFIAGLMTILFIRTDRMVTKREGLALLLFYLLYVFVEFSARRILR